MRKEIKLYSSADWDYDIPWDDLFNEDTDAWITIMSMSDLLSHLKIEYKIDRGDSQAYFYENILDNLENDTIQTVISDYDSDLTHDIYIPERMLTKDLIRYHLNIFNYMHPKLPNFIFIDKYTNLQLIPV